MPDSRRSSGHGISRTSACDISRDRPICTIGRLGDQLAAAQWCSHYGPATEVWQRTLEPIMGSPSGVGNLQFGAGAFAHCRVGDRDLSILSCQAWPTFPRATGCEAQRAVSGTPRPFDDASALGAEPHRG